MTGVTCSQRYVPPKVLYSIGLGTAFYCVRSVALQYMPHEARASSGILHQLSFHLPVHRDVKHATNIIVVKQTHTVHKTAENKAERGPVYIR